jgi:hypothetical protein
MERPHALPLTSALRRCQPKGDGPRPRPVVDWVAIASCSVLEPKVFDLYPGTDDFVVVCNEQELRRRIKGTT